MKFIVNSNTSEHLKYLKCLTILKSCRSCEKIMFRVPPGSRTSPGKVMVASHVFGSGGRSRKSEQGATPYTPASRDRPTIHLQHSLLVYYQKYYFFKVILQTSKIYT